MQLWYIRIPFFTAAVQSTWIAILGTVIVFIVLSIGISVYAFIIIWRKRRSQSRTECCTSTESEEPAPVHGMSYRS